MQKHLLPLAALPQAHSPEITPGTAEGLSRAPSHPASLQAFSPASYGT